MDSTAFIASLIAAFFGGVLGCIITSKSWENDCTRLGSHLSNGKVYECRVKP